ncbi:DUF2637 domain-containing protein [Streptomyces axinellae]|uniref:DUF2637 domain-containing protein n=1 Tax=Streptomyces axinellae TaxID=552788 RepID=A0ABN3R0P9_9ACTN
MTDAQTLKGGRPPHGGVPTAGATPDAAGATPVATPATPDSSRGAPGAESGGGRRVPPPATGRGAMAGAAPSTAPATGVATPATPATPRRGGGAVPTAVLRVLAVAALVGMIPVTGVGFAASYSTLRDAALTAGFADWLAPWVPIGIDGAIIAFLAMELYMVARGTPWPLMRFAAHGMAASTVLLNATVGTGKPLMADPVSAFWHGLMPLLFVAGVEGARRLLLHAARLSAGLETDSIPLHRWLLAPWPTARLYRRMRLAGVHSYPEMIKRDQDLRGYEVWLKQELGGDLKQASDVQLLPMTMAGRGFTVEEALALPGKWKAEAEERERTEAERHRMEDVRRAEQAKADRLRAIRDRGELAAAEHETDAEVASAEAEAERIRGEAERIRRQAERTATAEEEAFESAEAAAAKRKAAEDTEAAVQAAARTEKERHRAEAERAEANRKQAEADENDARAAYARRQTQEHNSQAAVAEHRAAEWRAKAAEIEARAVVAEDYARLTTRQRRESWTARRIWAAGGVQHGPDGIQVSTDVVPLAEIEQALGISQSAAGEIRSAAVARLQDGFDPATAYNPQG